MKISWRGCGVSKGDLRRSAFTYSAPRIEHAFSRACVRRRYTQPKATQRLLDHNGQALVEFAITIPILALILAGAFQFGEIFLVKQKLQQAAKYGVWLVKEGEEETEAREKLLNFLTEDKPKLSKKRISRIDITDISLSSFYSSSSKLVEIEYEFIPIKLLNKFVPVVKLKGRCVLTADPWHYGFPGGWENLIK